MDKLMQDKLDPTLAVGSRLSDFEIVRAEYVPELEGAVYEFAHTKSKHKVLWLQTADTNRAFAIAFQTPPKDSTGVFHILEHSVLCGSNKYPVKEPFVDLFKTSMQTFLNAFTFSDKTMYPVSSTNVADLENLMDVYLDAVFHPRIYSKKQIFEQEGWHLELQDTEAGETLTYNGVVYNEMKGALSDPDDFLVGKLDELLYPDTCYRYVSGGDPKNIPNLSYEDFLDSHSHHYSLDNSKSMLYGDLDIERELDFLAKRFAAVKSPAAKPNILAEQKALVPAPTKVEMATDSTNAALGMGYVLGKATDIEELLAQSILWDALAGTNEAPLKKAVLEAGLCDDLYISLQNHKLQPYLLILAKGLKEGHADDFVALVQNTLASLVQDGIDKRRLEASIAYEEFSLREGSDAFGSDGIAYAVDVFSTWLYSEDDPVCALRYEDALAHIKAGLKTDYFEKLLETSILKSEHHAQIELVPKEIDATKDEKEKLEAIYKKLTEADKKQIKDEVEQLRSLQEAEDAPEDLAKLPRLSIQDLADYKAHPAMQHKKLENFDLLYHDLPTKKIIYARQYFPIQHLMLEDIAPLALMSSLFGKLATDAYTAEELDTKISLKLGNLTTSLAAYNKEDGSGDFGAYFKVSASALPENVEEIATLPAHIWAHTNYHDEARIYAILQQEKQNYIANFTSNGSGSAVSRLYSQISAAGRFADEVSGVNNYLYLTDLLDHWDEKKEAFFATLDRLQKTVFTKEGLFVSLTSASEEKDAYLKAAADFGLLPLGADKENNNLNIPLDTPKNEAFIISGMVNYVAEGASKPQLDLEHPGLLAVASQALSLDYLWNEVRVKGGAYGAGFKADRLGNQFFWSFRDPSIDATLERYGKAKEWLASWKDENNSLEGYIVSSVARCVKPLKPKAIAALQESLFFKELPQNYMEEVRSQILEVHEADMRDAATRLHNLDDEHIVCVFGTKAAIEASQVKFDNIVELAN